MAKSKNKEWRDSGSKLSFKDWLREDLNKEVHQAVEQVNGVSQYSGQDGSVSEAVASSTFKDYTTGSVLGINQYVLVGGAIVVVAGIAFAIWYKKKKTKRIS